MSQSDYIKLKKTTMVLKNKELPPILDPSSYTDFVQYNLETTVTNTKNSYSRLLLNGNKNILDMEKKVSSCPTFPLCVNTNTRTNRVLNTGPYIVVKNVKIPYTPNPTKHYSKDTKNPMCPCLQSSIHPLIVSNHYGNALKWKTYNKTCRPNAPFTLPTK